MRASCSHQPWISVAAPQTPRITVFTAGTCGASSNSYHFQGKVCSCKLFTSKASSDIQVSSSHPYKMVVKVLKFVFRNRYPGAHFTYTDEEPSRLDYAKEIYRGPFKTEQVVCRGCQNLFTNLGYHAGTGATFCP